MVLCKLRNCSENNPEALDELNQIVEAVETEREQDGTRWKELMEPWNRRRLAIGCFMQIAQQWTGTNAIVCSLFCYSIRKWIDTHSNTFFFLLELLWTFDLPIYWFR